MVEWSAVYPLSRWWEFKSESRSVVSDSLWPHELYRPWNSLGQNTGVGSLSLLQRIFPTQGLNWGLLNCRWILYQLSYQGHRMGTWVLQIQQIMLEYWSSATDCSPVSPITLTVTACHSHSQVTHRNDSTLTTRICGLQICLELSLNLPKSRSNQEKKALDFILWL